MSGSTFVTPVTLDTIPKEGSRCYVARVQWASTYSYPPYGQTGISLLQPFQSGQFTSVQSVYVDNATVPYRVRLTCLETGLTIHVPPFSQGTYNLLTGNSPSFVAVLDGVTAYYANAYASSPSSLVGVNSACTTSFYFLNTPRSEGQRLLPSLGMASGSAVSQFRLTNAANALTTAGRYQAGAGLLPSILPAVGANSFYQLRTLIITVTQVGTYTTPVQIPLYLAQGGTSGAIALALLPVMPTASGTPAVLLQASYLFDPPLQTLLQNAIVSFGCSATGVTPPTGGPYADGSGYIDVQATLSYGVVTIS